MDRKRLNKLCLKAELLRNSHPKARELRAFAKALGRKKVKRGKEPMFESQSFPNLWPLAIPDHRGKEMPTGTKNSILSQLEDDLIAWDAALSRQERGNGSGH